MIYAAIVSFISGIVFEKIFSFGWSLSALIFLISLFIFFHLKKENDFNAKRCLIIGLALGLGILRMGFVDISPDAHLAESVGQKISFEATVSAEPDARDDSVRYTVSPADSGSKILLVADRFPGFDYGDRIKVSGELELPENFDLPAGEAGSDSGTEFDYVNYLAKDKIHFMIYRPQIEKIGERDNKFFGALYSIKNIFIEKISDVVPEPNSSLLAGVIFGVKQSLGTELLDDFKKAGLIHIVVLSGYNITIIAAGVFYGLGYFGKRRLSFVASVLFISLFAFMVGLGATVVRACIMAFIALLARFLGRPADALRWLFIAALLMLAWNPLTLFYDPSFQLSFMATLGLIIFSQPVFNLITRSKISKFIPTKFALREIVSSTLAVQFFVLPLLIKMSGFVSLVSFLVNPLVLPLVPYAMGAGALTGAAGLLPFVGKILSWPFGAVSYLLSGYIINMTELAARLQFAILQTGATSFWVIVLWYGAYGFIWWKINRRVSGLSSNLSPSLPLH